MLRFYLWKRWQTINEVRPESEFRFLFLSRRRCNRNHDYWRFSRRLVGKIFKPYRDRLVLCMPRGKCFKCIVDKLKIPPHTWVTVCDPFSGRWHYQIGGYSSSNLSSLRIKYDRVIRRLGDGCDLKKTAPRNTEQATRRAYSRGIVFIDDNARPHTANVTQHNFSWILAGNRLIIDPTARAWRLVIFIDFSRVKSFLGSRIFNEDDELKGAVNTRSVVRKIFAMGLSSSTTFTKN